MQRDEEVNRRLKADGWQVFRFWDKEITKNVEICALEIKRAIHEQDHISEK